VGTVIEKGDTNFAREMSRNARAREEGEEIWESRF
jgi:hypothetical protein